MWSGQKLYPMNRYRLSKHFWRMMDFNMLPGTLFLNSDTYWALHETFNQLYVVRCYKSMWNCSISLKSWQCDLLSAAPANICLSYLLKFNYYCLNTTMFSRGYIEPLNFHNFSWMFIVDKGSKSHYLNSVTNSTFHLSTIWNVLNPNCLVQEAVNIESIVY